jgi:hypothetical protein
MGPQSKIFKPAAPVVGLLNNPCEWNSTIYGRSGFRKKVLKGASAGVELLEIGLSRNNVRSACGDGLMDCLRYDGAQIVPVKVRQQDIAAIYDFYCEGEESCGKRMDALYLELMNALEKAGKPFVNPMAFTQICMDKWATYTAISGSGILQPATAIYGPKTVAEILESGGLAFIKKRNGTEGTG